MPAKVNLLAIGMLGLAALAARAQEDVSWIVDLVDSPDWTVRERATEELAEDRVIDVRDIEKLLEDESLSAEARLRIETIVKRRFMDSPRAAIGMTREASTNDRMGITVSGLEAGWDAERVLTEGDRIIEAQERPVRDWEVFRAQIISNDPGDVFEVKIVREGVVRDVSFKLGSYAFLPTAQALSNSVLEQAWLIRASASSKHVGSMASADTGFVSEQHWDTLRNRVNRDAQMHRQSLMPEGATSTRRGSRGRMVIVPRTVGAGHQGLLDIFYEIDPSGSRGRLRADPAENQRSLDAYRASLRVQTKLRDHLISRLSEPDTSDATRRYLLQRLERTSAGIRLLESRIEVLERENSDN
jgi:hypothetical protein